jgi:3-hydroxyacyl-CoA dehydrogenase/enoyl-CoA hydratase/3-hydroxybutyryl-CoA epimerase
MAVVGAGLMGAGIALTAAQAGIEVRVKDTNLEAAGRAKAYADEALAKQVARGSRTAAQAAEVLARIHPVGEIDELAGVQLVVEAVFEDPELKAQVLADLSGVVGDDALIASNTSTLPISGLAASVDRPEDFVGMHFFSPVERMELVEIIVGEQTSEETLAKAFDIARQLRKTPIVVGDGRGFFTSRVILGRLLEAAAMLGEGIPAPSIEQASRQAGYPLGTLALTDDISLSLPYTIYGQIRDEATRDGGAFVEHPGAQVLGRLVGLGRKGRASGSGYYDYHDGRRTGLWGELATEFGPSAPPEGLRELEDRLLFVEALETARCLETGVLRTTADANTGSLLGIGYPRWTGGAAQFAAGYPGGVPAFVRRARDLAERHGPRFLPPESLSGEVWSSAGEDLAHA